jgi:hypothetical protein
MGVNKIFSEVNKLKTLVMTGTFLTLTNVYAYATDGETQFNNVLSWILGWIQKIGIVLAVWGAVQIALSFSNEDAGQRRNGILQFISGLMVMAIGYGAKTIIGY